MCAFYAVPLSSHRKKIRDQPDTYYTQSTIIANNIKDINIETSLKLK